MDPEQARSHTARHCGSPHSSGRATADSVRWTAQRLHGQTQRGFGLEEHIEIDLVMIVDVGFEVIRTQLSLLSPSRGRHETRVHRCVHRRVIGLEAARAHLRHPGPHPAVDEDDVPVLLDRQLEVLEPPRAVLERLGEGLGTFESEPFFRYF